MVDTVSFCLKSKMSWSRLQKVGAVCLGGLGGASLYWYVDRKVKPNALVLNSWTTNYEPKCPKWDTNWDHRDPKSLVAPPKKKDDPVEENKVNERLEKVKPKAMRHLILIRHGQYNVDGGELDSFRKDVLERYCYAFIYFTETDLQRVLTEVGRKQAGFTGNRLKTLNINWTKMHRSTMSRAQETGHIISQALPDVPVEHSSLLEEGAPIPPEPPIGHWRPETSASQLLMFLLLLMISCFFSPYSSSSKKEPVLKQRSGSTSIVPRLHRKRTATSLWFATRM